MKKLQLFVASLCGAAFASAATAATGEVATIQFSSGGTYTFDIANGTDQGVYVDPRGNFRQDSILVTNRALPNFRVYFRPDLDSSRDEVVFEAGDPLIATPADLGAYTVTIVKNGSVLATVSVPAHYWFSRWRWQSAPRPVTATIAQLVDAKFLPAYDCSQLGVATRPYSASAYTPMTLAGLVPNMAYTGERGDIGLITEWQADYVCYGQNLSTVRAQAEAGNTYHYIIRDTRTGAPLDPITYSQASLYPTATSNPLIHDTMSKLAGTGSPIGIDGGHEPNVAYLPFLLTGDPYDLELLQFQVIHDLYALPYTARYTQSGRYLAWPLRNMFEAATVTPAWVPSWLLPRTTMQAVLNAMFNSVNAQIESNRPDLFANFGVYSHNNTPGCASFAFWQQDMLSLVAEFGVLLGHSEWRSPAQALIVGAVNRTNGTSGWQRAYPAPYDFYDCPLANLAAAVAATDTVITVQPTVALAYVAVAATTASPPQIFPEPPFPAVVEAETMLVTSLGDGNHWAVTRPRPVPHVANRLVQGPDETTWAGLWKLAATVYGFPMAPNPSTLAANSGGSVDYPSYLRAALALANKLGFAQVGPSYTWINQQLIAVAPKLPTDRKWMVSGQ